MLEQQDVKIDADVELKLLDRAAKAIWSNSDNPKL